MVKVRDLSTGSELDFSPEFRVKGLATACSEPTIKNVNFSFYDEGPWTNSIWVQPPSKVYWSIGICGLSFTADHLDARLRNRLLSPDGKAVVDWQGILKDSAFYHPATFSPEYRGWLTIPSSLPIGTYELQFELTDNASKRSGNANGILNVTR